MDSRLRFLHCAVTELWGRARERRAGEGNPAQAREARGRKIPSASQRREAERTKVAKSPERAP